MSQLFRTANQTTNYSQIFGSTPQFASLKIRFIGGNGDLVTSTSNTNEFIFINGSDTGGSWFDMGVVDLSKIYVKAASATSSWYAIVNPKTSLL